MPITNRVFLLARYLLNSHFFNTFNKWMYFEWTSNSSKCFFSSFDWMIKLGKNDDTVNSRSLLEIDFEWPNAFHHQFYETIFIFIYWIDKKSTKYFKSISTKFHDLTILSLKRRETPRNANHRLMTLKCILRRVIFVNKRWN